MTTLSTQISGENKSEKPRAAAVFVVKNDKGLHTRPSVEIVRCATRFRSKITLSCRKVDANAKSLLGIMMLAASRGSKVKIEAEGVDAEEAVQALLALSENKFNIKY
jgi:phosphocarrier protein HPr